MLMKKTILITGGSSGIGKALAIKCANEFLNVWITGRRIEKLNELKNLYPDNINVVKSDLSVPEGRQKIEQALKDIEKINYLVHNAADLGNIKHLLNYSLEEWRYINSVNLEAPLFLTSLLLRKLNNSRILFISSGAAQRPISGWGGYCITKAGLLMLKNMLNAETKDILVGSVRPGVVDTAMQDLIRDADLEKFPHLQKFHDLYKNNELEPPEKVARFLFWILEKTSDDDFITDEWDIRDEQYQEFWNR